MSTELVFISSFNSRQTTSCITLEMNYNCELTIYIGWAKSKYTVIIFFFTGVVNDGREFKYRKKKVDFEAVLEN